MSAKVLFISFFIFTIFCRAQHEDFSFYIETKGGKPLLHLTSSETFPCAGYGIKVKELWNLDTLIINIRGFVQPQPCYQEMEQAKEAVPLWIKQKDTTYINFRWKENEDAWIVVRDEGIFSAQPLRSSFTAWKP
ncbi:MAG: hypothetical protein PHP42_03575 [Bacteroidota bacterium]|nr:hypothetical protein [Bacteroidota bacterium]